MSTGATPFSLVYGMEVVLPVEVQIPSLRVLMDVKLQEADRVKPDRGKEASSHLSWVVIPATDEACF